MWFSQNKIGGKVDWEKSALIVATIGGGIGILTAIWYIIVDRFKVIHKLEENTRDIDDFKLLIKEREDDKILLIDIQYNLRRLLEKSGIRWESLTEQR
jgi:hypothetical protein